MKGASLGGNLIRKLPNVTLTERETQGEQNIIPLPLIYKEALLAFYNSSFATHNK